MAKLLAKVAHVGSEAFKFQFEVVVKELRISTTSNAAMAIKLTRGSRTANTPEVVGISTVYEWREWPLRMVCTMYKKKGTKADFQKKEAKLQVRQAQGSSGTKTVAFAMLDFSLYATLVERETEVVLPLQKCEDKKARMVVVVRGRWLKELHGVPGDDVSAGGGSDDSDDDDIHHRDQDLEGFEEPDLAEELQKDKEKGKDRDKDSAKEKTRVAMQDATYGRSSSKLDGERGSASSSTNVAEYGRTLSAKDKEIADLRYRIDALRTEKKVEVATMTQLNQKTVAENERFADQVARLTQERDRLNVALQQAVQERTAAQNTAEAASLEKQKAVSQLRDALVERDKVRLELQGFEQDLAQAASKQSQSDQEIRELKATIRALETSSKTSNIATPKPSALASPLPSPSKSKVEELEFELTQRTKANEELDKKCLALTAQVATLTSEKSVLQEKNEANKNLAEKAARDKASLDSKIAILTREKQDALAQAQAAKAEGEKSRGEVRTAQQEKASIQGDLKAVQTKYDDLFAEYSSMKGNSATQSLKQAEEARLFADSLKKTDQALREAREELRVLNDQFATKTQELETQIENLRTEKLRLEDNLKKALDNTRTLTTEKQQLESENQRLSQQNQAFILQQQQKQKSSSQQQQQQQQQQIQLLLDAQQEAATAKNQCNALTTRVHDLEAELDNFKAEREMMERENTRLKEENTSLLEKLRKSERECEKGSKDLEAALKKAGHYLEERETLKQDKAMLEAHLKARQLTIQELHKQQDKTDVDLAHLQSELAAKNNALGNQEKELAGLKQGQATMAQDLRKAREDFFEQRAAYEKATRKIDILTERCKEFEQVVLQLENAKQDNAEKQGKIRALEREREQHIERSQKLTELLRQGGGGVGGGSSKQKQQSANEEEHFRAHVEDLLEQTRTLELEVKKSRAEVVSLRAEKAGLLAAQSQFSSRLQDANSEVESLKKEKREWKEKEASTTATVEDLKQQLANLQSKLRVDAQEQEKLRAEEGESEVKARDAKLQLQLMQDELQALKRKAERDVDRLNGELMVTRIENQELRQRQAALAELTGKKSSKKEVQQLQDRIQFYEGQLKAADDTIQSAKILWQESTNIMDQQIVLLEAQLQEARQEQPVKLDAKDMNEAKYNAMAERLRKSEKARAKLSELVNKFEVELVGKKVELVNEIDRANMLELELQQLKESGEAKGGKEGSVKGGKGNGKDGKEKGNNGKEKGNNGKGAVSPTGPAPSATTTSSSSSSSVAASSSQPAGKGNLFRRISSVGKKKEKESSPSVDEGEWASMDMTNQSRQLAQGQAQKK